MRIEAVTVCVDYADMLAATAPINRALLDRWIVVTHPSDTETRDVCRNHSIECLATEDMHRAPGFQKANGINRGLDQLQGNDWLLHLDADIALPFDLHQCLAGVRRGAIHGCDRLNVLGWQAWQDLQAAGLHSRKHGWLIDKERPGTTMGAVPAGPRTGYAPIGFFQLWHGTETHRWQYPSKRYPELHADAARTDAQFGLLWDRPDRVFLPELIVFHLESEKAPMGANWRGRKTARFSAAGGPYRSLVPSAASGPQGY